MGRTDIQVPRLGLGTWQWGDRMMWNYGKGYAEADIRAAFDAGMAAGIAFFDTAEIYGQGRSERFLGRFMAETRTRPIVATKFMPLPWRLGKGSLRRALHNSLQRLGLAQVDLYQIHWPFPPVPIETWMDALADAVEAGLARAVGVSNYNVAQMRRAHAALARRGIPLASNQVHYSLLHRDPERTGLLDACRELGVTLIAYSPLEQGLLSGKYGPQNPPPGLRGRRYRPAYLARIQPAIETLRAIGERHGKAPNQVALNWLISKGAVPIPGAKNARQVQENAGALGWRLTAEEIAALDGVTADL
ncbi:MAG: aldo/keto reductase [Anaerolineae bacterium]